MDNRSGEEMLSLLVGRESIRVFVFLVLFGQLSVVLRVQDRLVRTMS